MESYFNRTIESMEDDRIIVKDQFYTQKQSKIINDVKLLLMKLKIFIELCGRNSYSSNKATNVSNCY